MTEIAATTAVSPATSVGGFGSVNGQFLLLMFLTMPQALASITLP